MSERFKHWIGMSLIVAILMPLGGTAAEEVHEGRITGMVVNGTDGRQPLAGVEVVLRAGHGASLDVVAKTVTDERGRFEFVELPTDTGRDFVPGANLGGVHYPGTRVRLSFDRSERDMTLVAYEAVESPSPLVVSRHEIVVQVERGFLEVTESLCVDNPSLATYVGEPVEEGPTVTLRLTLPPRLEKVTFDKEFFANHFLLRDSILATEIPWTPGARDIRFRYRVPIEPGTSDFRRTLDLPTGEVVLRVLGKPASDVASNIGQREASAEEGVEYRHSGETLTAGTELVVHMGRLPVRWERYARWLGLGALSILVIATIAWQLRRSPVDGKSSLSESERPTEERTLLSDSRTLD